MTEDIRNPADIADENLIDDLTTAIFFADKRGFKHTAQALSNAKDRILHLRKEVNQAAGCTVYDVEA